MIDRTELQWSTVEYYLGEALGASYRLSHDGESPLVTYEVDGSSREIALLVELDRYKSAPQSTLPAIAIDRVDHHGKHMARIRTTESSLTRDFHDLALAVAGRIVNEGRSLHAAFRETVRAWSALLDQKRVEGVGRRIGLHGELAMLSVLAERYGWATALESWTGPAAEEHDFAFPIFDIEVKTTASERRRHSINGLDQLVESGGRPLWFVSVRVTRGGAGGRTLSESIDAVRNGAMAERKELGARVTKLVSESRLDLDVRDDERWTLRDEPLVLPASSLPRLSVDGSAEAMSERILSVRYDIDVTGMSPAHNPPFDISILSLP